MDEKTFWVALEYRVCREFCGLLERHRRYWWCDGFVPEQYSLELPDPKITGHVWMCNGPQQELLLFTLFLNRAYHSHEEVVWSSLLPPEDVTCWLAIDEAGKAIQLEPSASIPDFPI